MQKIKVFLAKLADAYGYAITPARAAIYAEMLAEHGEIDFDATLKTLLATQDRFPSVSAILDAANSYEVEASGASNRIFEAVGRFGYPNALEAAEWLGPFCWLIVQKLGGWRSVCEQCNVKNRGVWIAQARDLAATVKMQEVAEASGDPQIEPGKVAKLIGQTVKEVPK